MAIITLDGIVAGLKPATIFHKAAFTGEAAGSIHNLFGVAGNPSAAVLAAPGLNGATVNNVSAIGGMLPWTNPVSRSAYLARMAAAFGANIVGLILYDLLWYNTGIVSATTTAQNITSPAWPARDKAESINGDGLELLLHTSVTCTNAGAIANTTFAYTNQAAVAGRVAGTAQIVPITPVVGTIIPFALQAGDTGIKSIQSITLGTSYGTGTVNLMLVRRIASVFGRVGEGVNADAFAVGMPKIADSSALYLAAFVSGTAAGATTGEVNFTHG